MTGCGGSSGGAANGTHRYETMRVQGVSFVYPEGWTSTRAINADGTGVVRIGPAPAEPQTAITLVFTGRVTDMDDLRATRRFANGAATVRRTLTDRAVTVPGADEAYLYDRVLASMAQPRTTARLAELLMIRPGHQGVAFDVLALPGTRLDVDAIIQSVHVQR